MILAERISKYYGALAAISDLTFCAAPGEVVGLLGLNGAGKTTTLRILSGLLVPTAGKVVIDGIDMAEEPEAARARIGFLPESPPLYPEMTVDAFLRFVARINGVNDGLDAAVASAAAATGTTEKLQQRIGTLSHGFQRRVGIAHASVHNPKLILLDEPTGALDPVQIVHMRELIRSLRADRTIIVSSHILSEVRQMCDRILVLHQGKKIAEGTPDELQGTANTAARLAVDLEVRGSREALARALAKVGGVAAHRVASENDDVVAAVVQLEHDCREELVAALLQAGLGLRHLARAESGLESVFLKLTAEPGLSPPPPPPPPLAPAKEQAHA